MKPFDKLKQDIIGNAGLTSPEASGFYAVHCPICRKESKKTGGWKFEHDRIGYNCFRASCDASTVYEEGSPVPRKMRRLLDEYAIKIPVELLMVRSGLQKSLEKLDEGLYKKHTYKQLTLPEGVVPFEEGKSSYQEYWEDYFEKRECSLEDIFITNSGKYEGLAVVGLRFYDKLVSFSYITRKGVYIAHNDGNTHILYTPEKRVPETVIVVEGILDAKCFPNTVAVLGSKINPEQAYHLRGKRVIMLPDKSGNDMIKQFHRYGWEISLPDWDVKDLNEAVCKYGSMVAADMIMGSLYKDKLRAETKYKMWKE